MNQDNRWKELREKLADIEHQRWSAWQLYLHSKCHESCAYEYYVMFPREDYDRWERQINTDYKDLTEKEKQSDMDQVDRYWPLIDSAITSAIAEAREDERSKTVEECIKVASTHDEHNGRYCDTGDDMEWACRSMCMDLAIHRLEALLPPNNDGNDIKRTI